MFQNGAFSIIFQNFFTFLCASSLGLFINYLAYYVIQVIYFWRLIVSHVFCANVFVFDNRIGHFFFNDESTRNSSKYYHDIRRSFIFRRSYHYSVRNCVYFCFVFVSFYNFINYFLPLLVFQWTYRLQCRPGRILSLQCCKGWSSW